jgi:hypothetical protein
MSSGFFSGGWTNVIDVIHGLNGQDGNAVNVSGYPPAAVRAAGNTTAVTALCGAANARPAPSR